MQIKFGRKEFYIRNTCPNLNFSTFGKDFDLKFREGSIS
jgi:hypothetical protein